MSDSSIVNFGIFVADIVIANYAVDQMKFTFSIKDGE